MRNKIFAKKQTELATFAYLTNSDGVVRYIAGDYTEDLREVVVYPLEPVLYRRRLEDGSKTPFSLELKKEQGKLYVYVPVYFTSNSSEGFGLLVLHGKSLYNFNEVIDQYEYIKVIPTRYKLEKEKKSFPALAFSEGEPFKASEVMKATYERFLEVVQKEIKGV